MLFIILWAVVVLIAIAGLVWFIWYDGMIGLGIFVFFAINLIGFMIAGAIGSATLFNGEHDTRTAITNTETLQALAVDSSVSGHFFLGSGTVDGKRVLNYITVKSDDTGTYSEVKQIKATDVRIYQDSDEPRLDTRNTYFSNPAVWPGEYPAGTDYFFHVPAGSILEDYTIDNSK